MQVAISLWLSRCIAIACIALSVNTLAQGTSAPLLSHQTIALANAQAVRGNPSDVAPPISGWQTVTLPDLWQTRWPVHNGVVWYRLSWEQADTSQPVGLMMDYLIMAGKVYVNGQLLSRDEQLTEPLTRAWNTPRYWLVAAPILKFGENTIWVQVHGAAAHHAGLGGFTVGSADEVSKLYRHAQLWRYDSQLLGLGICATVVFFFGVLWLMRREATVYGWLALMQAFWLVVGSNHIVTSPWPFASNDAWQAFNSAALIAYAYCFVLFSWRFWRLRYPRLEIVLAALVILVWIALMLIPVNHLANLRALVALLSLALSWTGCLLFVFKGLASPLSDERWLSLCMASILGFGMHDLLVFLNVFQSNLYFTNLAATMLMLGMSLVLAYRFVISLRKIEGFNLELQDKVNQAKAELAATLQRQTALEVANARLRERTELARDLHDGLGGMLVGNIAALENAPANTANAYMLNSLKDMRDDLRLIVDTTNQGAGSSLADLLAPLRRRFSDLLEANGIACEWLVNGLNDLHLATPQALDILRFLQEALTNVLKHSRAKKVQIQLTRESYALHLSVLDDGLGFNANAHLKGEMHLHSGLGIISMHSRAKRLNATLHVESAPGRTYLHLHMPLDTHLL